MAVPTSGEISLRSVARERAYPNGNGPDINAYTQGTIPPGPYALSDVMVGFDDGGSGYDYCPPMDNLWPQSSGPDLRQPYDPALQQGTGYAAQPYAMSEFRGHIGNRELGCVKLNFNTNCYPTGNSSISASAAGQSFRWEFDFEYTPKSLGATMYMEINQSWAGIDSSSDTTGGSGVQNTSFIVTAGSRIRYLNVATNTGSQRTLTLSIYISGSCYSTNNFLHTITVTQAAGSGGGGGPTKPDGGFQ